MKKGKEIKLDLYDNYVLSCGTVDNKNPKAIYIEVSAWGEPQKEDDVNYTRVIGSLNKTIKQTLFNFIDDTVLMKGMSIIDLDMRESGISYNKRSFMNCEITLFQRDPKPVNSDEVLELVESIISELVTKAFDTNKYFKFYKKKKTKQMMNLS